MKKEINVVLFGSLVVVAGIYIFSTRESRQKVNQRSALNNLGFEETDSSDLPTNALRKNIRESLISIWTENGNDEMLNASPEEMSKAIDEIEDDMLRISDWPELFGGK